MSQFKVENQQLAYERGYEAGKKAIPQIKELLKD